MQSLVSHVYRGVIDDVCAQVKPEFVESGVDEAVLDELRVLWETNLLESGALDAVYPEEQPAAPKEGVRSALPAANLASASGMRQPTAGSQAMPQASVGGVPFSWTHQQPVALPMQQQYSYTPAGMAPISAAPGILSQVSYSMMYGQGMALMATSMPMMAPAHTTAAPTMPGMPQQFITRQAVPALAPQRVPPTAPGLAPYPVAPSTRPQPALAPVVATLHADSDPTKRRRLEDGSAQPTYPGATYTGSIPQQDGNGDNVRDGGRGSGEGATNEAGPAGDGEAVEEDDNLDDVIIEDEGSEDEEVEDFMLATFEQARRTKKGLHKAQLNQGIAHIQGRDYLFSKALGEMQF